MLFAGHETTATMLSLGTLALLRHPEQLRIIRDQPAHVDAAIEELLRWLTIGHTATPRVATEPVEIAGQRIEAGERVLVSLPAAGHGVHHCIGVAIVTPDPTASAACSR
jgi:cytochrome P450